MVLKKNIKVIIGIILFILLVSIIHFTFLWIDYIRIKNSDEPIFSFSRYDIEDGGSKEYVGLGYKFFYRHSLWNNGECDGFIVGTETKGIPFLKNIYKILARDSEEFVPYDFGKKAE